MTKTYKTKTWAPVTFVLAAMTTLAGCSSGGSDDSTTPPGPDPLTITTPAATPGTDAATLQWSTSLATTAVVEYGVVNGTLLQAQVTQPSTTHSLDLTGLLPGSNYRFQVTAQAADGRQVASGFQNFFTQNAPTTGTFVSDDFFAFNLDRSRWNFTDPLGGARLRMLTGENGVGALELSVAPGVNSSPWLVLNGARVTQPVPDENFGLETSFLGTLDQEQTGKGLVFEQDPDNWARFDFAFNNNKLQLFAAVFKNGGLENMQFTTLQNGGWIGAQPLGMRVTRTATQYQQEYSLDGVNWTAGFTMSSDMEVRHAGVFIAAEGAPSNGVTAVVDYVERIGDPLINEDGQQAPDVLAPLLYASSGTALGPNSAELAWFSDEKARAEVRYGRTPAMTDGLQTFDAMEFAKTGTLNGLVADSTYYLEIKAIDALGQASTHNLQLTTMPDQTSGSPTFAVWDADLDGNGNPVVRFGDLGFGQPQVNVLGNVQDADEDRVAQSVTLEYRLGSGAWLPLALGDDRTISYAPWRLANEGDFNLELTLAELTQGTPSGGVYQNDVLLRATDDDGHTSFQSLRVDIVAGNSWDPNYSVDWNSILNQGGRASAGGQIVDGRWNVENVSGLGSVLRTDPTQLGYDRLVAIGEGQGPNAWENYEAEMDVTILGLDPQGYTTGTASYAFGFVLRWTGHTANGPYPQPNHNIYPFGAAFLYRWFDNHERWELWRGYDEGIQSLPNGDISLNTRYSIKLRCEDDPSGGQRYRMKLWAFGSSEPSGWTYDYTSPASDTADRGSVVLVAHHADVAFGNIQVTELP